MRIHLLCLRESDPGKNVTQTKNRAESTRDLYPRDRFNELALVNIQTNLAQSILVVGYWRQHRFEILMILKALRNGIKIKSSLFVLSPFL